ncbi:hypothetical protein [Absidia glauca]|uniref:Uncharacterized protein n=1 Tax=Absidia glauca TaxID=4829 RepID=A0A168NPL0_ABSGL|nr:hypothetical protein [Absidia glauca]
MNSSATTVGGAKCHMQAAQGKVSPKSVQPHGQVAGFENTTSLHFFQTSVVMDARIRPEESAFQQCNGYGFYYGRALSCDIKQWASRHRRHRLRYRRRRRRRRSRSKSRKQKVGHAKLNDYQDAERRGESSFVRSFVRRA